VRVLPCSDQRITGSRRTPARGESAKSLLESRVREIRPHGSEGERGTIPCSVPTLSNWDTSLNTKSFGNGIIKWFLECGSKARSASRI